MNLHYDEGKEKTHKPIIQVLNNFLKNKWSKIPHINRDMSRTRENPKIVGAKLLKTSSFTESIKTEKYDANQIQLPFHANHCIFCGSECPAKFIVHDGEITRIKSEMEPSIIERQLKSLFIARNILGVTQKICHELLSHFDGQLNPEHWLSICHKCNEIVEIYSTNLVEIARLVREAELMKMELKRAIWASNSGEENEAMAFSGVWKETREQALIGFKPSQVRNPVNQSTHEIKTIVKVEQDDLNCIISLILLTFLYTWDNDNDNEPGTNAKEDVNVLAEGSCLVVTENEEMQMETDPVVMATFVEENTEDFSTNSTTMKDTGDDVCAKQNQPNYEQADEDNTFLSIYKKLTSEKNRSLITEHKRLPIKRDTAVFVKENSSGSCGTLTAKKNGKDDDDFCEVICVKSIPRANELQSPPINIKKILSPIYTKLQTNQFNKQIPMETEAETTVKIETSAKKGNTTSHTKIIQGNPLTPVSINVSRTNGSIIISSKPESSPATPELFIIHSDSFIEEEYRCTKCPAKFSNQEEFKSHRVLHQKGVPAEACPMCGVYVHCTQLLSHNDQCSSGIAA